jgi:hypothetical protein
MPRVPASARADTVQPSVAATGTADHLAWEARQRRPAAIAAMVGAVLTLVGAIYGGIVFSDVPRGGLLESLQRAARTGPVDALPSLRVPVYQFYDDHAAGVLASTLLRALGLLGLGWALTYLAAATRARRSEFPRFAQYLPIFGAVLSALATVLSTVATILAVKDFLDGPRTVADANEITQSGLLVTAQLVNLPGLLALAIGIVLTSLNAMRSGLLTRFMGVLGIITGALLVFPIGSPLPIVQCFWLFVLGLVFLGRWPGGRPPAWEGSEAMPWPSGNQRRAGRGPSPDGRAEAPAPAPTAAGAGGGAARKKRKRRA